jgi:hypothetical protein
MVRAITWEGASVPATNRNLASSVTRARVRSPGSNLSLLMRFAIIEAWSSVDLV